MKRKHCYNVGDILEYDKQLFNEMYGRTFLDVLKFEAIQHLRYLVLNVEKIENDDNDLTLTLMLVGDTGNFDCARQIQVCPKILCI